MSENDSKAINYDELFVRNKDSGKIFKGQVIFIQNASTYSSAGLLVTDAVDNLVGIVIGSKSSFKPCHYGDMLAWQLKNTGIKGYVSHKFFTRPNTVKCIEEDISPSVSVSYTLEDVLKGEDVYWKWIMDNYGLTYGEDNRK